MVPRLRERRVRTDSSGFCLICGMPSRHKSAGIPRGYAPLVARQEMMSCPRMGGREP